MALFFGPTDNWSWDPSFYYAHIRSPIIDGDLDFRNETKTGQFELPYTRNGLQHSLWPLGPSLLWSPFFLLAHGLTLLINPAHADGFSFLYIAFVTVSSLAFGMVGLGLLYQICRYYTRPHQALLITLLCLGATPLFFYMFRQPLMAHTTGLAAAAGMLLGFMHLTRSQAPLHSWSGAIFGVGLVLCFLTRWNGILMGVLPAIYFAAYLFPAIKQRSLRETWPVVRQIGIMLTIFGLLLTPQLALWYRLHGTFFMLPQDGGSFVASWLPTNLLHIFFHTNRGLLYWSPLVILGMLGIFFIPAWRVRLAAILIITMQLVLIGYRRDWYSGGGFGARYFIELLPFLVLGLIALLQRLPQARMWNIALGVGAIVLVIHQFTLLYVVERITEGWIEPAAYFQGQPLGLAWQYEALLHLVRDPLAWFSPRPYVGLDRQTIVTSLLTGPHPTNVYAISGTALVLSIPVALLFATIWRLSQRFGILPLLFAITAYFVAWALFILVVG
ncbi:hypothetical protein [Candidatus Viridilinea mediisalina]|uniref:Glycosyltransferase RgtA/B/C/D-like domain-containing protein n=1 Tax=Candidatus Viridilinea mediisalina TaxID=2024553 RepID=A0A2A6RLX5_9CHLR|nr:hypothetical protein [Candidatus Viridilinea mediisalina]PDW03901.1 hypothetical protein CJ255_06520 [Candidatus Viridilinea mediisalina]